MKRLPMGPDASRSRAVALTLLVSALALIPLGAALSARGGAPANRRVAQQLRSGWQRLWQGSR